MAEPLVYNPEQATIKTGIKINPPECNRTILQTHEGRIRAPVTMDVPGCPVAKKKPETGGTKDLFTLHGMVDSTMHMTGVDGLPDLPLEEYAEYVNFAGILHTKPSPNNGNASVTISGLTQVKVASPVTSGQKLYMVPKIPDPVSNFGNEYRGPQNSIDAGGKFSIVPIGKEEKQRVRRKLLEQAAKNAKNSSTSSYDPKSRQTDLSHSAKTLEISASVMMINAIEALKDILDKSSKNQPITSDDYNEAREKMIRNFESRLGDQMFDGRGQLKVSTRYDSLMADNSLVVGSTSMSTLCKGLLRPFDTKLDPVEKVFSSAALSIQEAMGVQERIFEPLYVGCAAKSAMGGNRVLVHVNFPEGQN